MNQISRSLFFIFLLLTINYSLFTNIVYGQHFTSPSFNIDWGNFNITSGRKTSTNYSLTDTVGQNAPGAYQNSGYFIKSGFQYIYDTFNQLSLSIDNLNISLGTLAAGSTSTATNTITISTPSGRGYQVLAQYNHPLTLVSGTTIPDTSCDSNSCNPSTSGVWSDTNVYGFGYNVLGVNSSGTVTNVGTSSFFTNSSYYRPFSQSGQAIIDETGPVKSHSARVTYKANVSAVQAAGTYQNSIIYTLVPKY